MTPEEQAKVDAVSTGLTGKFYVGQKVRIREEWNDGVRTKLLNGGIGVITMINDVEIHLDPDPLPGVKSGWDPYWLEPAE